MAHSRKLHLASFAVAALVLTACGGGGADTSGEVVDHIPVADSYDKGGEFRWAYTTEVTSLDPHRGTSGFDQNWLFPVYDRLIYSGPAGDLEPMLATAWEQGPDSKSITLTLREDVTFSDGTPFDAEAVKFSLDRARDEESTVAAELADVSAVEVLGKYSVRLDLRGGAGAVLSALSDRAGMIVSPKAARAGTLATEPVGVGAYGVIENRAGDRVVYERSEDYWFPDAQRVKTMTFRVMADDQTRLNALRSGELDMALIRQNQVEPAHAMGMTVLAGQAPTFYFFGMNTDVKPFDDVRVRRAISQTIDREAIGNGLLEGYCTPQIGPWPSTSFAYDSEIGDGLSEVPHDPDAAKKLLADAGLPDGFSFEAAVPNITGYTAVGEAVQEQLRAIGVKMELRPMTATELSEEFSSKKSLPVVVHGYSPSADPNGVMTRLLLPTANLNPGGYSDPELAALAHKAAAPLDAAARTPVYAEMLERMIDTPPAALPICMQHRTEAVGPGVSGISINPSGARDFRGVAMGD